jgi:hypothetical protein
VVPSLKVMADETPLNPGRIETLYSHPTIDRCLLVSNHKKSIAALGGKSEVTRVCRRDMVEYDESGYVLSSTLRGGED